MSTLNGLNTARVAANGKRAPGTYDGRVKVLKDSYAFGTAIFSASDFIKIGTLPAGARVIDAGYRCDETGTTGAFSLGTVADPDGFVAAGDTDATGGASKKASTEALIGVQCLVATDVIMDCTEATDDAALAVMHAWVEYVMEPIEA